MINRAEEANVEEYQLDLENRIRNLLWTVSGDYSLDMKPDVSLFLRSKPIALYDGIRQGAFARYYDKELLGLYLVKKIYLQASEKELASIAWLCMEEAVGEKICQERPGVRSLRRRAFEDILDQDFDEMPSYEDVIGRLKIAVLRNELQDGGYMAERQILELCGLVYRSRTAADTMELIRIIDDLYNRIVDPDFERRIGSLDRVMAVTLQQLTENGWEDFLSEEMYEDALESYVEKLTAQITEPEKSPFQEEKEENKKTRHKVTVLPPEALEKAHSYVELNFGKTYLSETEEKKLNYLLCREAHSDCSLYFTEGILKNPVRDNYQYQYAKRLRNKNLWVYHEKHRLARRNIASLTELLQKSLVVRREALETLSDRGIIVPSRVWRVDRSREATVFRRVREGDDTDFVVEVLIDASGSQMSRQGEVALQAYMISEALSNVEIPHRVMSYCTFWDYTILHRFRDYDDPRSENENIFNYVTSSNNRDGLAIKAAGLSLLSREEEKKILIVLSDGRPYDVVVNRPNARNPRPYLGKYAVEDTAAQVRRLRGQGVSVLGVFAGEEKDLATEKKIFGKDFAYIRSIVGFSRTVGRYLTRQLEMDE
ncbi:MAG: nitric oxide reductase activation protein [Clostridiales bacterium]|nr:nitric oxide reductase activation protein [Clostridiales bacterium]